MPWRIAITIKTDIMINYILYKFLLRIEWMNEWMNEYNESPMRFWLSNVNNDQLNWRQIASDQYASIEMNFSLLNHLLLTVNDGNGTYLKECKSSRLPRPLLWNRPVTSLRSKLRNWENNQIGAVVWLGDWNALKRHQLCNEKNRNYELWR